MASSTPKKQDTHNKHCVRHFVIKKLATLDHSNTVGAVTAGSIQLLQYGEELVSNTYMCEVKRCFVGHTSCGWPLHWFAALHLGTHYMVWLHFILVAISFVRCTSSGQPFHCLATLHLGSHFICLTHFVWAVIPLFGYTSCG